MRERRQGRRQKSSWLGTGFPRLDLSRTSLWVLVPGPKGLRASLAHGLGRAGSPLPSLPTDLSRLRGRGQPGGRARHHRATEGPQPRIQQSRRASFPSKAGSKRAAQVPAFQPRISRDCSAQAPLASQFPAPARGCSSQTMEREQ